MEKVNKHDLWLITGDMNAKVGSFNHNRERAMGKHGTGIMNSNGERLNNLVICYEKLLRDLEHSRIC